MPSKRVNAGLAVVLAMLAAALFVTGTCMAAAQSESVLYSFGTNRGDGIYPYDGLIFDGAGNLYGTTEWAGTDSDGGTAFELTPATGGGWTEKVLCTFSPNDKGGSDPYGGLILDGAGNLYGTASSGGAGYGTVFQLTPQADGSWMESVLHEFGNGQDGRNPYAGLVIDATGHLYGTTLNGGAYGYGTAFKLTHQAGGKWTERILHNFGNGKDGRNPSASLVLDAAGNLYGTTAGGGNYSYGTVFELELKAGGGWTETALHEFGNSRTDGQSPYAGLIFDATGNLYTTTAGGGAYSGGTVVELAPKAGGGWRETVLHNFNNNGSDAASPYAGLAFDTSGNLYGTTYYGVSEAFGSVFQLAPTGGAWTETSLYDFYNLGYGGNPFAGVILDAAGNLYGTTSRGGAYDNGEVFEITP